MEELTFGGNNENLLVKPNLGKKTKVNDFLHALSYFKSELIFHYSTDSKINKKAVSREHRRVERREKEDKLKMERRKKTTVTELHFLVNSMEQRNR